MTSPWKPAKKQAKARKRIGTLRYALLAAAGLSAATSASAENPQAEQTAPNILVIVLDDVGYSDIGSFGSEIATPAIDAIAADGLRYNRFDTKAVCTPTRAALLTGRNPQTVRMADLPAQKVDPNDLTRDRGELAHNAQLLPQVLHSAGYATHGFGKWHLAPEDEDGSEGHNASWPLQRGFDDFYGFYLGWTDQYHPDLIEGNKRLPTPDREGYHFSEDITNRAIAALTPKPDQPRKPQFVYLAYGAGHAPIQVPRPYIEAYAGQYDRGWDRLRIDRLKRMKQMHIVPADTALPPRYPGDRAWSELSEKEKKVYARFMEVYAGFITHTDEQIGRIVHHLKATGQYENTVILIMSDNGAASEGGQKGSFEKMYRPNTLSPAEMLARIDELGTNKTQSEYQRPWAMAGVTPFRRYKLWPQLGGVRTPMIVSWPEEIEDAGAIRHQYVDVIDLAPTLVDLAGTRFPEEVDGRKEIPVAGKSIRATLMSGDAPPARDTQYFEMRGNRAITQGKWRDYAIHKRDDDFANDEWHLYNTETDFAEAHDLAETYPEKLEEMKRLWWEEARKYSTPALAEAPKIFRYREMFDDTAKPPVHHAPAEEKNPE
ncbi:arylsulfatase [Altericroceibacterium spongiae]|uniref:Arylsulfatase n=1 Tax=Altericroceibacterium spongiae TaxID=2320269 RepID=A0A420EAD3_9SPHN|nr:arylsulfatase [Altericroceibacterium spongiae]RKF17639.1 arylsulfatase [Altericroceibacterium spongiae]